MSGSLHRLALLSCVISACSAGEITGNVDGYVDTGDGVPSFIEFEQATYREAGPDGVYIVNGDTAIPNIKLLREYYDSLFHRSLIVNHIGGADSKWDQDTRLNLRYCISDTFGSHKAQVIGAMAEATENGWHEAADVQFVYDPSQDANCTANNNNVLFDVRPTSGAPYLARAFFPGQSRSSRNVIVDSTAFNAYWPLSAILAHELGHSLGFRHEHTRPEAGTCFEDNQWRPLTPYDSASIMHYPQCNGYNNSLSFSQLDFDGAAALYGAPGESNSDPEPSATGTAHSEDSSGSLSQNEQINLAPIAVVGGTSVEVTMSGSGDADLYLRFDSAPTLSQYDCRPYLNGSSESCSVDVPASATQVFVMVHGYTATTYSLTTSWVAP